jgi:hypothetical protein
MENKDKPTCPHCGARLLKWIPPAASSWGECFQYACFNDECSYYQRGWDWMKQKFNVTASYRYRLDPATGDQGPLPVWSKDAIRNMIAEDDRNE